MKKILVCCNAGVSTTLLVNKLKAEAAARGDEFDIEANPLAATIDNLQSADAVLLAPQVAYAQPNLQEGTKAPVYGIDPNDYARADAPAILDFIEGLFK